MLFFIISIRPRQVKSGNRNFRKLQRPAKGVKEEGERHLSPFAKGVLGEAGRPPLPPEGGGGVADSASGAKEKRLFLQGQQGGEFHLSIPAGEADLSLVGIDDRLGNGQSQPEMPVVASCGVHPVKALENMLLLLL